ncbi:hypothetical protein [uncultured Chloroflexus sp.]|uniref:hypothetical protein n=1 Tax=uncultured Chloroflexus sp. TaxID=214040 RepID=UPI00262E15D5|nr:hypothetical protein [uncultured Chloroflexus sp.]
MDPVLTVFLKTDTKPDQIEQALYPLKDQLSINDKEKMDLGFSLFLMVIDVDELNYDQFDSLRPLQATLAKFIKDKAVVAMAAYAAFVLMHEEALEKELTELPVSPVLEPFRDFFRSSTVHHLRNAIRTGSFRIIGNELLFKDGDWSVSMEINQFLRLCNRIRRFYERVWKLTVS